MSPTYLWPNPYYILLLIIVNLTQNTSAALSLQQLQAIAKFPTACQDAYQTPIQSCPDASSFSLSGFTSAASVCSTDCFDALTYAAANIQEACQGTAAPPGTVIAHAFSGDLAYFLCGSNSASTSSSVGNTSPGAAASTSGSANPTANGGSSLQSTTSTSQSTTKSSDSKTNSTPASTSTQNTGSTSTNSSVSSSSGDTASRTSTVTSLTTSKTVTSSSSSSSSISKTSEPTLNPGGGGSPFDQTVPNAAPTPFHDETRHLMSLVVGVALAVAVGS